MLARQSEVISYDARGSGRSGRGPGPYREAADLAGLLDALQVKQAVVISNLYGTEAALELALDRPELVSSLILVSPRCGSLTLQLAMRYLAEGRSLRAEAFRAPTRRQRWIRRHAELRLWMMAISNVLRTTPVYWHRDRLDQYVPKRAVPPACERLQEIVAPTLIVVGEQTNGIPRDAAEVLRSSLYDARLVTIPDVGEYPAIPLEAPAALFLTVLDFLGRILTPQDWPTVS